MTWHLMDAALPLQSGDSFSHLAARKLLDGLFQLRIALPDNLLQFHRLHARVLELGENAAGFNGFMLAGVAYQQNAVVRMQAAYKLVHLFGGRKRTLVHHIEPVFARVRPLASGKMGLQSLGIYAGVAQLLRRAARRRKALDLVPGLLRALAHHGQRRRLAPARHAIHPDNLLPRQENLIHRLARAGIQLRVPVSGGNTNVCRYQHWIAKASPVALLHLADGLALHAQHGSGGVLLARAPEPGLRFNGAELARLDPAVELLPDLGEVRLAHAPAERRRQNRPFILDRRTLEEVIAGIGYGYLGGFVGSVCVLPDLLPRLGNHPVGLVAVLRGKHPMLPQHLFWRKPLLGI